MIAEDKTPIFTCGEIIEATGGVLLKGAADQKFSGISTDSRHITRENLFVALKGENFDGHDFLGAAMLGGVHGLLIEERAIDKLCKRDLQKISVIGVRDTLAALGDIAHFWRQRFKVPVIAITGSAGKTTTKEMSATVCALEKNILKTEGNFNNLVGLPLTLLKLNDDHEAAIIEMGTNRPGEIARLAAIAAPTVGVITNIGAAHLEGLKSIPLVRKEKGGLFSGLGPGGIAVINLDDENTRKLGSEWRGKRITFSLRSTADITAKNILSLGPEGMRFDLIIEGASVEVALPLAGEHHVSNALAAAAASFAVGMRPSLIARGLSSCAATKGRTEIMPLKDGSFLINDAYNANPLSVKEAVKTLAALKGEKDGIIILGDMLELGAQSARFHEEIGSVIAAIQPAALFLKGDYAAHTAAGACRSGLSKSKVFLFSESQEVLTCLKKWPLSGLWILVKGSRKMKLDEVVRQIAETFGNDY